MPTVSEIDALKAVDDALSGLGEDKAAIDRVLAWAWGKYSSRPAPKHHHEQEEAVRNASDGSGSLTVKKTAKTVAKSAGKPKKPKVGALTLLKDLNLKPQGKKSFVDFVNEKKPATNWEKCIVAVHYLRGVLELKNVGASHVFTCFKEANWRAPSDLRNTLQAAASREGWLDTKDTDDIKVTPRGDNLVEHDLPPSAAKKA